MAGLGDYTRYQAMFASKTTNLSVLAATTTQSGVIVPKSADHQLYIQRITVTIGTYSAKTVTFQDSASTPIVLGIVSIAAAAEAHLSESNSAVLDFGPTGFALTKGKNLDVVISAAGAAYAVHIEAYEKLVGPVAAASTN